MVRWSAGRSMDDAPKDRPILVWCDHEADPRYEDAEHRRLTLYAAHYEGLSHQPTGFAIVVWGGGWVGGWEDGGGSLPDWWFVQHSEFEIAANPVRWWDLPGYKPKSRLMKWLRKIIGVLTNEDGKSDRKGSEGH